MNCEVKVYTSDQMPVSSEEEKENIGMLKAFEGPCKKMEQSGKRRVLFKNVTELFPRREKVETVSFLTATN